MKRKPIRPHAKLIKQYIETHSIDQSTFAKYAEVPQGMVSQWVNDRRPVSAKAALLIEKNTAGEISRYDLCPDVFSRESAA